MKTTLLSMMLLLGMHHAIAQNCIATITPGGPTTFCAGDSVKLSANNGINTWTQKANFAGTKRFGTTAFSIGNKGYMGTGADVSGNRKDFWEYNPVTNAWTQKADFVTNRVWAVGFSIGNKGYVGTGVEYDFNYKNDFWEYDPATNAWTQKANFAGIARRHAAAFSIGNKGYIGTGVTNATPVVSDFWEYDPALDTWTQKANFGGGMRWAATGFSIANKGYITTGRAGTGSGGDFEKDLWAYDPSTNTWTKKADFGGTARIRAVSFSIGNKGYLGTGYDYSLKKDFWEYNPATDVWTQKLDFGGNARDFAFGFSIGGKGYIGTGDEFNGVYDNDLWEYNPGSTYLWSTGATSLSIVATIPGTYTVSVTDAAGCFATSDPVDVVVHEKPVLKVSDINVSNTSNECGALVSLPSGVSVVGNPDPVVTYTIGRKVITSPYVFEVGSTLVHVIATNECGTNKKELVVRVVDNQPPIIRCKPDATRIVRSAVYQIQGHEFDAYASDNCRRPSLVYSLNGATVLGCSPKNTSLEKEHLKIGTTIITWKATDQNNNISTCITRVTIVHKKNHFASRDEHNEDDHGLNNVVSDIEQTVLTARVVPNPSSNYFRIQFSGKSNERISIRAVDVNGKIVESKNNIPPHSSIEIGSGYHGGTYILEVLQGNEKRTVTLIKRQ